MASHAKPWRDCSDCVSHPRLANSVVSGESARMSLAGAHARYDRLLSEQGAWRLLRSDNAPLTLAFLTELFAGEGNVEYSQARTLLDAHLDAARARGRWEADTSAGAYLH